MRRLYYLDKLGWPVELVKGRWFLNFLRILIRTRKITFRAPGRDTSFAGYCKLVDKLGVLPVKEVKDVIREVIDHEQKILVVEKDFGGDGYRKIIRDLQIAAAVDLQKSHGGSLEMAAIDYILPNALTRETLEKSERGDDIKSCSTVEELFEDLDSLD